MLCFRMLLRPWLMPRLGAMLMMWVSFFLHCRLVYTEGDTTALLHIKWQIIANKQTNTNKKKQPSSVGREKAFRGLSVATHAVGHHFSNSKKTTKNKKRKKNYIFYLIPQIFCSVYFNIVGLWFLKVLVVQSLAVEVFVVDLERG